MGLEYNYVIQAILREKTANIECLMIEVTHID